MKAIREINKSHYDRENYRRYYNDWFKQKHIKSRDFSTPSTKLFDSRRKYILEIAKYVAEKGEMNILDLGCGEETYIENLVKISGINLYGVDISDFVIDLHKRAYQDHSNVRFIACPAEELPFDEGYFDLVICDELIEHVPKAEILLDEIGRVIKKDGILIISTPNRNRISAIFKKLVPQKLLDRLSSNPMNSINPLLKKEHHRVHYHEHEFSLSELIKLLRLKKFTPQNMIKTTMILFPPKLYDKLASSFPQIDKFWRKIDFKTIHSLPGLFKVNLTVVSRRN